MITQYKLHPVPADKLPLEFLKPYTSRASSEMYEYINYFTNYTKNALEEHNFTRAKKCLVLAEKMYLKGDAMIRFLIENSFIYSFSSIMFDSGTEMFMLKSMLPDTLYQLYKKQAIK